MLNSLMTFDILALLDMLPCPFCLLEVEHEADPSVRTCKEVA